jgi:hypothetical protein
MCYSEVHEEVKRFDAMRTLAKFRRRRWFQRICRMFLVCGNDGYSFSEVRSFHAVFCTNWAVSDCLYCLYNCTYRLLLHRLIPFYHPPKASVVEKSAHYVCYWLTSTSILQNYSLLLIIVDERLAHLLTTEFGAASWAENRQDSGRRVDRATSLWAVPVVPLSLSKS